MIAKLLCLFRKLESLNRTGMSNVDQKLACAVQIWLARPIVEMYVPFQETRSSITSCIVRLCWNLMRCCIMSLVLKRRTNDLTSGGLKLQLAPFLVLHFVWTLETYTYTYTYTGSYFVTVNINRHITSISEDNTIAVQSEKMSFCIAITLQTFGSEVW